MGQYSLGEALQHFMRHSRMKGNMQALQITDVWEQIMGATIAKYTESIQISNKTLFINTSVAPLRNELTYQKEKIIQRVNEALGETVINEVVIR
ncbi:MAG: DUF721 domain-containing protein [Sphingobacteriales bacterium]|nr:MAG: DUF721 domain-containing protein [Sphingobacteriales bacterium]